MIAIGRSCLSSGRATWSRSGWDPARTWRQPGQASQGSSAASSRRSQSRACARVSAKVRLPTPSGPTKRKACGSFPWPRLCRRLATIRSCPRTECQGTLHLASDPPGDGLGVGRGVDDDGRRRVIWAGGLAAEAHGPEEPRADARVIGLGPVLDPVARRPDAPGLPRGARPAGASGRAGGGPWPPGRCARPPRPAGRPRRLGRRCWPAGSGRRQRTCHPPAPAG